MGIHCRDVFQDTVNLGSYYSRQQSRSAWVSLCLSDVCLSVSLFIRISITKTMTPKCSNLVQGIIFGVPRNDVVLELKGQRSRLQDQ